jgi:hypothetical protein
MRSEAEIMQMIEELRQIDNPLGSHTAQAVIAALNNVLNGPRKGNWMCGCLGPAGCCVCMMSKLATPKEIPNDR